MAHSSIALEEVSSLSVASAATTSTCVGTLYQRYATTDWSLPLFFSKSTQEIKVSTGRVGVNIGQSHTSSDAVMLVKTNLRPLSDRKVWADEHICGIFVKLLLLLHLLSRFFQMTIVYCLGIPRSPGELAALTIAGVLVGGAHLCTRCGRSCSLSKCGNLRVCQAQNIIYLYIHGLYF